MSGFGDHVLVLGPEFIDRLLTACGQQKVSIYRGLVKYLDEDEVHGKIPSGLVGFVKLKRFAPEREYRFVFEAAERLPDPFILDVGPLDDVTMLMRLEDFKKNMRIQFVDDDSAAGA